MTRQRNIRIEGKTLTIRSDESGAYEVFAFEGMKQLGTFHFSTSKDGLAGYSNNYGKDMYVVSYVGNKPVYPVYADTQRSACEYILRNTK